MRSRKSRLGRRAPAKTALAILAVMGIGSAAFIGSSSATLTLKGSTFDSTNGDLTSPTLHDWNPTATGNLGPIEAINCATLTNCGTDLVRSQADNAFGQGAKEDDLAPSVVTGSIPPSKDDLSRFYVNKERTAAPYNKDILYLAWERSNLLGSAHMDFEFNQDGTASSNGVTRVRTPGDQLIDFDFGGSGVPDLTKHEWVITSTPATDCETSNSTLGCWSKNVDLTTGGLADGSVNKVPVFDRNPPNAPRTLDGNTKNGINSTFGEAAIDLTDSGIFPTTGCRHFGSAMLKSRSSGNSFTSELKDFVAPIPVNISNCGRIDIIKQTNPRGIDKDFGFTSNLLNTDGCLIDATPAAFTLNDKGNTTTNSAANTESCTKVPVASSRTITEDALPAGYTLDSLNCVVTTAPGSYTVDQANRSVTITVGADGVVTCTYVDKQQLGALKVIKESSVTGNQVLAGATFQIKDPNGTVVPSGASDVNGVVCIDGLTLLGDYTVKELTAPPHYSIDDTTVHTVTVTGSNAQCSDANFGGQSLTFYDSPLTDLVVKATSQDSGPGGSQSTITCTNDVGGANIGNSPVGPTDPAEVDATGLVPGNYTCKVFIDP